MTYSVRVESSAPTQETTSLSLRFDLSLVSILIQLTLTESTSQGTMEVGKQLDLWTLLVNPLQNVDKHNSSLMITTGFNTLQGIVSMDNFLVSAFLSNFSKHCNKLM